MLIKLTKSHILDNINKIAIPTGLIMYLNIALPIYAISLPNGFTI
jgi:hypothetical protein